MILKNKYEVYWRREDLSQWKFVERFDTEIQAKSFILNMADSAQPKVIGDYKVEEIFNIGHDI